MLSLKSPQRGDSNLYVQYTIFNNMKIGTAYRRARRSLHCCPQLQSIGIELFSSFMSLMRGAVVEWLKQLGYGVESRRIA